MTTKNLMKRLWSDDSASNSVEYGLITAVIAVALIVTLVLFKDEITGMFTRAGSKIKSST